MNLTKRIFANQKHSKNIIGPKICKNHHFEICKKLVLYCSSITRRSIIINHCNMLFFARRYCTCIYLEIAHLQISQHNYLHEQNYKFQNHVVYPRNSRHCNDFHWPICIHPCRVLNHHSNFLYNWKYALCRHWKPLKPLKTVIFCKFVWSKRREG